MSIFVCVGGGESVLQSHERLLWKYLFLTVTFWVHYSEGLFFEVLYPPIFYCQFVYATCTLTSFVYKLFLFSFFWGDHFLSRIRPKVCTFLSVCLPTWLVEEIQYSVPSARCWQQGQTSTVKQKGIRWDFFSIPALCPTTSFCPRLRSPHPLDASQPCVLSVMSLLRWHTVALPHLPRTPPVMTNAPYGCLQGNLA